MKRLLLALAVVFAVAGMSACNAPKPPDAGPAQAAVDAAHAAGVDAAVYPDMKSADDSLASAKAEIDKQKKKFSMMQDYKSAAGMLATAQSSAEKALSDKKAADEAAAKKAAEEAAAKAAMKKGGKKGGMKKKM